MDEVGAGPVYYDKDCTLFDTVTVLMVDDVLMGQQLFMNGEVDTCSLLGLGGVIAAAAVGKADLIPDMLDIVGAVGEVQRPDASCRSRTLAWRDSGIWAHRFFVFSAI